MVRSCGFEFEFDFDFEWSDQVTAWGREEGKEQLFAVKLRNYVCFIGI
jgi:hypothetical protein